MRDQMIERLDPAIEAEVLHTAADREEAPRRRDETTLAGHAEAALHDEVDTDTPTPFMPLPLEHHILDTANSPRPLA